MPSVFGVWVLTIGPAWALVSSFLNMRLARRPKIALCSTIEERGAHGLEFDHVEMFVEELLPFDNYAELEAAMDDFTQALSSSGIKQRRWYTEEAMDAARSLFEDHRPLAARFEEYDVVAQLICGLNWRLTATEEFEGSSSAWISPPGPMGGATFVVTASERSRRFCAGKGERQGIGALGFRCRSVAGVREAYLLRHPALVALDDPHVFEAYAYYDRNGEPDKTSTVLRFVERPKIVSCYENECAPRAVFDHWVSNVYDRERIIATMADALGLTPRVEFDAGVIAAGAAAIESTVVGGDSVYLPVNNALTDVGHVAAFLDEIGQGVQHIASRVDDLVAFVSVARMLKHATGRGFNFLQVPRTYYGRLDAADLASVLDSTDGSLASFAIDTLREAELVDASGLVSLDATNVQIDRCLEHVVLEPRTRQEATELILRHRYSNAYKLLGDTLDQDEYVSIVRNRILVDIQGGDAILQIFTGNILQRDPDHEAPFLEFIQRICSSSDSDDQRLGCGGFGIRNFLALFLSIELNAAMQQLARASSDAQQSLAVAKIDCLSTQLDLSNPILNEISAAAVDEATLLASPTVDSDAVQAARKRKLAAQAQLKEISRMFAQRARDIEAMAAS